MGLKGDLWDGRRRVPISSWLDGLYGQTPEKSRRFLDRGGLGRKVGPWVFGGRNRGCV